MSDEDTALLPLGVLGLSKITAVVCGRCGCIMDTAWGQSHLAWHRENDVGLQPKQVDVAPPP